MTIKEIAEILGVSVATVSMALNDKPGISEKTRLMVLEAVEKYNYSGIAAKRNQLNVNGSITFIVYKSQGKVVGDTQFFSELMESIELECRELGFNVNIVHYIEESNSNHDVIEKIKSNEPSGIILLGTEININEFKKFKNLNIPLVLLDNNLQNSDCDRVTINNVDGICNAVEYLVKNGHKEISYIHSKYKINNFIERKEGYKKGIIQCELRYEKIFEVEPSVEGSFNDFNEILNSLSSLPTAIIADNDLIAIGVIKSLKNNGYNVPNDVSIIGFDDIPSCLMIDPELTTIGVSKRYLGKMAVSRLAHNIEFNEKSTIKIEIDTNLVMRKSVKNLI